MNNNKFSWTRVAQLLRYDWAVERSRVNTCLILVAVIYAACVALAFYGGNGILSVASLGGMPMESSDIVSSTWVMAKLSMVYTFFGYVAMASVVLVTTSLHRKFTNPQTATAYLALPGTRTEKYVVQLAEYLIAWLAAWVLYVVAFYLTEVVCVLTVDAFGGWGGWGWNPFYMLNLGEVFQTLFDGLRSKVNGDEPLAEAIMERGGYTFWLYFYMSPFINLLSFIGYVVVNMLFKHNGQIKTIAIGVAAYAVCIVVGIVSVVTTVAAYHGSTESLLSAASGWLTVADVVLWLVPVATALLFWVFWRQIRYKQAK